MAAPLLVHSSGAVTWVTDLSASGRPQSADMAKLSSRLPAVLTAELAAAQVDLSADATQILIAALGRAVARTVGGGEELVVDVDTDDSALRAVAVRCVSERGTTPAAMLAAVRQHSPAGAPADVLFSYRAAVAGTSPDDGYLLTLHARRGEDVVYLDWWYDTRSFDRCTLEELSDQFPLALIEVTSG